MCLVNFRYRALSLTSRIQVLIPMPGIDCLIIAAADRLVNDVRDKLLSENIFRSSFHLRNRLCYAHSAIED